MTHHRPQVEKRTVGLPEAHHLEGHPCKTQCSEALLWMTRQDPEGKCFFTRLCENYENPQADF